MWTSNRSQRPSFAEESAQGQESVWDYPRPPGLPTDGRLVEIYSGDRLYE